MMHLLVNWRVKEEHFLRHIQAIHQVIVMHL